MRRRRQGERLCQDRMGRRGKGRAAQNDARAGSLLRPPLRLPPSSHRNLTPPRPPARPARGARTRREAPREVKVVAIRVVEDVVRLALAQLHLGIPRRLRHEVQDKVDLFDADAPQ